MKKALSLILAALLCAAMTPAVMAEEAVTEPVDEAIVDTTPAEAVEEVVESNLVYVDVEAVVALAATYGIEVTPEVVTMILNSGIELNEVTLKAAAVAFGLELPDEFITALIALIAATPAPIAEEALVAEEAIVEEVAAEEVVVEEVAVEEVAAEEAVVEEAVVEEAVAEEAIVEEAAEEEFVLTLTNDPFLALLRKNTKAAAEKTVIAGEAGSANFLTPVTVVTKANGEKTIIAGTGLADRVFLAPVIEK